MSEIAPGLRTQLAKGQHGEPVLILHVAVDDGPTMAKPLDEKQMRDLQEWVLFAMQAVSAHKGERPMPHRRRRG